MTIYLTEHFKKQLKQLMKKYPKMGDDFTRVCEKFQPDREVSIGRSIYKIRIASSDQKKGKSGGFRCYTYFYRKNDLLLPLCVYAKATQESISDDTLQYHIDTTNEELLKSHFFE